MTSLERRNVAAILEHAAMGFADQAYLRDVLAGYANRPLPDEVVAEISRIRAWPALRHRES